MSTDLPTWKSWSRAAIATAQKSYIKDWAIDFFGKFNPSLILDSNLDSTAIGNFEFAAFAQPIASMISDSIQGWRELQGFLDSHDDFLVGHVSYEACLHLPGVKIEDNKTSSWPNMHFFIPGLAMIVHDEAVYLRGISPVDFLKKKSMVMFRDYHQMDSKWRC